MLDLDFIILSKSVVQSQFLVSRVFDLKHITIFHSDLGNMILSFLHEVVTSELNSLSIIRSTPGGGSTSLGSMSVSQKLLCFSGVLIGRSGKSSSMSGSCVFLLQVSVESGDVLIGVIKVVSSFVKKFANGSLSDSLSSQSLIDVVGGNSASHSSTKYNQDHSGIDSVSEVDSVLSGFPIGKRSDPEIHASKCAYGNNDEQYHTSS